MINLKFDDEKNINTSIEKKDKNKKMSKESSIISHNT